MILSVTRTSAALLAACMTLGGCATANAGDAPETAPAPPTEAGGACNASALTDLVGQPRSETLGDEAMKRSGARSLRWISPGMAVTQDYREDRLNIELDAANKVVSARCG
ncbi:hypothetical protein FHS96_001187 [Sphingomonas zeicaulis]|uniref:I78 family peptidase inhibitor n=1 Tax=Sphingomonas zeicaulis TaxID=1632740 RepID=UPI003D20B997